NCLCCATWRSSSGLRWSSSSSSTACVCRPSLGFIVAGVVLGPNALGLIPDVHRVEGLAEVGVILLLFTIGIEFSLSRLREMGRQVVVAGACQVGLTVAATRAAAAAGTTRWRVALRLRFLAALSSTAIVL